MLEAMKNNDNKHNNCLEMLFGGGQQHRKLVSIRVPAREISVFVPVGNEIAFMLLKIYG